MILNPPTESIHSLYLSTLRPGSPIFWNSPFYCEVNHLDGLRLALTIGLTLVFVSGHMKTTKMPTLVHWDSLGQFTSFPSFSLGDGVWHCAYYLMPRVVTERIGSIRVVPQTTCGGATGISWHDAENHSHWEKKKYELIFKTQDHTIFQQWDLNKADLVL